ncbi:MAG TPA: Rieske 2Fe-2S domain-containing protein [Chitinophagaceae bacterium]|nr:Rieske 2Fe-2S domain-containing protein [Chitinophagaceae bacterium]
MGEKKLKWYKIADNAAELPFNDNRLTEIKVHEKKVCLIKTQNGIRACAARCPHAGGEMSEGFLDKNENIVCPVHRYVYNIDNGRDLNNEGYYLKIYPVQINAEGIFIGIEEGGIFGWWR